MNTDRAALVAIGVIFTLIGTCTMICRVLSLHQKRRVAGHDEYAIWLAYLSSLGFAAASFISVRWGVGLSEHEIPAQWAMNCIQALYVIEVCYFIALYFSKLSVMLVYFRLATELQNILYRGSQILTTALTGFFFATIIVSGVQCVPFEHYFNPKVPGHCINITAFLYFSNAFTIFTDVIMLTLPLSTIWQAKLTRGQKAAVTCAFLAGGISTIASCVRLYSIKIYTLSTDPVRDAAPINIWSFIELNIAITCASVAAIKPLFFSSRRRPSSDETTLFGGPEDQQQQQQQQQMQFGTRRVRICKHELADSSNSNSDTSSSSDGQVSLPPVPDHIFACELHRQLSSNRVPTTDNGAGVKTCGKCGGRYSQRFGMAAPEMLGHNHAHVHLHGHGYGYEYGYGENEKHLADAYGSELV